MIKRILTLTSCLLFLTTIPVFAQDGGERTPITPDNTDDLILLAELPTVGNNNMAFSPDDRFLASETPTNSGTSITIWDTETWEPYRTFEVSQGDIWFLVWSPDGHFLASAAPDANAVRIWDIEGDALYREFEHRMVARPAWSPDGTMLSTAGFDEKLRVWDVDSGEIVFEANAGAGETSACSLWSPDGRWLLAGILSDGNEVIYRIWDTNTWEVHDDLSPASLGSCPQFSTDGQELVTVTADNGFIFLVENGRTDHRIEGTGEPFLRGAWSADGTIFATGSRGSQVMLWDTSGRNFDIPQLVQTEQVAGVSAWNIVLTDDGALLAAPTDELVVVWSTETGEVVATLEGHSPDVVRAEWSHDHTLLASTDRSGQLFVWGIDDN